ncbi:bifunctional oligoribonuclease/PAP phosphatase NrnA [Patescibacteria group bacterium]
MAETQIQSQIIQLLQKSEKILIMPSSPPDGDSIGSALALFLALKKLKKEVTVVCADPIPDVYQFLPTTNVIDDHLVTSNDFIVTLDCTKAKIDTIKTNLEDNKINIIISPKNGSLSEREVSYHYGPSKYDLIMVVDAGDLSQLGKLYEDNAGLFTQIPVINIDHHVSNNHFGKINLIDIMASSATELIIPIIEGLAKAEDKEIINEDIATLLLAGIITDTGSFQNANTSPKAFASAAHLLGYGARQQEIIQHIYKTKNLTMLKLWGRVLTKIQYDRLYRVVWSTISKQDFVETSSQAEETGDIIDELMTNAPGADVVLLIKEREDGVISCSVRTTSESVNASVIAEMFDGGGHIQAAGFKMKNGDLQDTEQKIIQKVREYQAKRLNIHPDEHPDVISGSDVKNAKALKESIWQKEDVKVEADPKPKKADAKSSKAPAKKVKKEDVVENIPEKQDEIDMEPGVTYKFEE